MNLEKELECVVKTIDKQKGEKINVLNISSLSSIADYFVIATALNKMHCQAICRYVEEVLHKECDIKPFHIEGGKTGEWILMDYIDFVVQLFTAEQRDYYQLDKLWGDAERVDLTQWIYSEEGEAE